MRSLVFCSCFASILLVIFFGLRVFVGFGWGFVLLAVAVAFWFGVVLCCCGDGFSFVVDAWCLVFKDNRPRVGCVF